MTTFAKQYGRISRAADELKEAYEALIQLNESPDILVEVRDAVEYALAAKEAVS